MCTYKHVYMYKMYIYINQINECTYCLSKCTYIYIFTNYHLLCKYICIYTSYFLICKYIHDIDALGVYPLRYNRISKKLALQESHAHSQMVMYPLLVPKALRKKDGTTLMTNIYILQRLSRMYLYIHTKI